MSDVTFTVNPGGSLKGDFRVPGDKSISHRSIMLGAIAEGVTHVSGFLEGDDSLATLQAFRDMGVKIDRPDAGQVTIHGVGLHGLNTSGVPIDLGNSGTAMRLMTGLLSGQSFDSLLIGDSSLSTRPMKRVTNPLSKMGAVIESNEQGTPPLKIKGAQSLSGIHYDMPVASAQVKSSLILAGLYASGQTVVTEPAPTRDHTERMLRGFGVPIETDGNKITLNEGAKLVAADIDVPSDISSATFFMVGAAISPGSDVTLRHVGINPTRIGVINILRLMGADMSIENEQEVGGEPVADIVIRGSKLKGIAIPEDQVALAIDEFPALFIAATCAEGETVLTGAEELRVKESDRIQVMADGMAILGIDAKPTRDGMVIQGRGEHQGALYDGGAVDSHGDHRIAMSFAMAALRASAPITIKNCANVATSFPNFIELAKSSGLNIEVNS